MTVHDLHELERRGLTAFVRRYPVVHRVIGLIGNALFITGSVLFLVHEQRIGLVVFLTGSIGMFLGQLGEVLRALGRRRLQRFGQDPLATSGTPGLSQRAAPRER